MEHVSTSAPIFHNSHYFMYSSSRACNAGWICRMAQAPTRRLSLCHLNWDETGFPQIIWRFSFSFSVCSRFPTKRLRYILSPNNELNPHSFLFSFIDLFSLPFLASALHPSRNCSLRIPFPREIHARGTMQLLLKKQISAFILQLYLYTFCTPLMQQYSKVKLQWRLQWLNTLRNNLDGVKGATRLARKMTSKWVVK